jgi:very-short-patch-repair endonuclease
VMIFSPVYSQGISPGAVGFLRNNGNLFNVAITRARAQLIVVGDLYECEKSEIDYLSNFAKYAVRLKSSVYAGSRIKSKDLGEAYPQVSNPEQVSDWEKVLYSALYKAGIRAVPQYRVEKYALDFAVFDGDRRLNIEVDGERYHRNWTGELCRRDQIRNQRMFELGWDVIRFWVYEIRDDLDGSVSRIEKWVAG